MQDREPVIVFCICYTCIRVTQSVIFFQSEQDNLQAVLNQQYKSRIV